jgi:hypothetical protein
LNVSNSSLDQLSAVIAAIQERGFDDVLTALHTQWDQESVLNDWISTPTWTESLAYLQQHAGTLTQPAIRDFLNASDEPVLRQHAAILTLGDHYPPATILRILTEPTETADLALHALETANLTTLAALLTACPATTRIRGVGPLLRAILLTAAGQEERAAAVLGDALAEFTTLQKRAYRIRLNKLLATENANLTPEFRNEVIAFIDLLNQNEPPPGEAVTD